MKPYIDIILQNFRTAIRNARVSPKTTAFGVASLFSGIAMLQTQPLTTELIGTGITAILIGIGYLLADDPTDKTDQNDKTTTDK